MKKLKILYIKGPPRQSFDTKLDKTYSFSPNYVYKKININILEKLSRGIILIEKVHISPLDS